jgi:UDP-N-acetylmuramate dehydrogenase
METLWQIAQKINTEQCSVAFDEPMSTHTTFSIGGPADLFLTPRSVEALASILMLLRSAGIPVFLLGGGANILVADQGIRGAVIDTSMLSSIRREAPDSTILYAECGVPISTLCTEALVQGLSGLENFYGMPGSVGGAIYMNARCYEDDISLHINEITAISPTGEIASLSARAMQWSYKCSPFMPKGALAGYIIAAGRFSLEAGEPLQIAGRMRSRMEDRMHKHHFDYPSAGSMFKNNRDFGKPTGKILHELGLRGYRIGNAAISPWHANIFINLGGATARDMRALILHAQAVVLAATGWKLEPEVLFVGEF